MPMYDGEYYAMGGMYRKFAAHKSFFLVRPSGDRALPYIAKDLRNGDFLFTHCQHYAHLYRIIVRGNDAVCNLVRVSHEAIAYGVEARKSIFLTFQQFDEVIKVIQTKGFYDVFTTDTYRRKESD